MLSKFAAFLVVCRIGDLRWLGFGGGCSLLFQPGGAVEAFAYGFGESRDGSGCRSPRVSKGDTSNVRVSPLLTRGLLHWYRSDAACSRSIAPTRSRMSPDFT